MRINSQFITVIVTVDSCGVCGRKSRRASSSEHPILAVYISNSNSESESFLFFCEDRMFFGCRAFVEVTAERILDEGSSSSSSSRSSSSLSSSTLCPPYPENFSGRSRAPVTSKIASNSKKG